MHLTADSKLSSCKSRQSSSDIYKKFLDGDAPTLFTRISIGPSLRVSSIKFSVDSPFDISAISPLSEELVFSGLYFDKESIASSFLAQNVTEAP